MTDAKPGLSVTTMVVAILAILVLCILFYVFTYDPFSNQRNDTIINIVDGQETELQKAQQEIEELKQKIVELQLPTSYSLYGQGEQQCRLGTRINAFNLTDRIGNVIRQTGFYIVSRDNISCSNLPENCNKHSPVCEYINETKSCICDSNSTIDWGTK